MTASVLTLEVALRIAGRILLRGLFVAGWRSAEGGHDRVAIQPGHRRRLTARGGRLTHIHFLYAHILLLLAFVTG